MCSLTEILAKSSFAGPLIRFSCAGVDNVRTGIANSIPARLLGVILPWLGKLSQNGALHRVVATLFLLNFFALLCGLCILDTGPIGLMTWSLLALGIVQVIIKRDIDWLGELGVIDLLVLAFLASAAVSVGFSSYLKYSVIGFAKLSTFAAGFFAFRTLGVLYAGRHRMIQLLYALGLLLSVIGLVESLIGFSQFFSHIDARATWVDPTVNAELNLTRIFGTLKPANPNLLAGFLIPCLAAAIGVSQWALSTLIAAVHESGSRKQVLPRLLGVAVSVSAAVAILAALVLTGSRGGFLAIAGIALVLFGLLGHLLWANRSMRGQGAEMPNVLPKKSFLSRRTLKVLWVLVLVGSLASALGVLSVSPQLQHRVVSIFAMRKDSSISYRLNVYNSVGQMIQDNPIIGIGPGNDTFKRVYGYYMVPGFNALGAYSVPLEILAEQGLVGFGVFCLLLLALCLRSLYFLDSERPLSEKMAVIVLIAGVIASILYGVFDTIWYRPSVNLLFWLYVALLAQMTRPLEALPMLWKDNVNGNTAR